MREDLGRYLVSNCLSREVLWSVTGAMVLSFWALTSCLSSLVTIKTVLFADVPNWPLSLSGQHKVIASFLQSL